MRAMVFPGNFSGIVRIPASKSHAIRQLLIASIAEGISEIEYPLDSLDTRSCVSVCRSLGAEITEYRAAGPFCPNPSDEKGEKLVRWKVKGNGKFRSCSGLPEKSIPLNVGNSGTTLFFALAIASLQHRPFEFTGDKQIQRRSAAPLLEALAGLGVRVRSSNGCVPIEIQGPLKGGKVSLPCPTSQYLSALLLACPIAQAGTDAEIEVPLLNEKPYIEMTLSYLNAHNISYRGKPDFSGFVIPGGSAWKPFCGSVPGDFSSAAFPAAAAAITGGPVTILGLDPHDSQGDKFFFEILARMGCNVQWNRSAGGWEVTISRSGILSGGIFDLNATPDLLPAAAVVAAYSIGDTSLVNVAHARLKESDRIAAMVHGLAGLGVDCTELPDGLVIHGRGLPLGAANRCLVDGKGDHRVVMAFAVAALSAQNPVEIDSAESVDVTYPGFFSLLPAEIKPENQLS